MAEPVAIELLKPGVYDVPDTRFTIICTDWTGPKGGRRGVWEVTEPTPLGPTIYNGCPPAETLAEAREFLADAIEAEANDG